MHIGEVLKEIRLKRGMTQVDVCESTGLRQSHLSLVESGHNEPSKKYLIELAKAYGVEPQLIEFATLLEPGSSRTKKEIVKVLGPAFDKIVKELTVK